MNSQQSPFVTLLEHSGDLMFQARGANYLEALANASIGLVHQIIPVDSIREAEERELTIAGDDETSRTVAFLNELLYFVNGRLWLPRRVRTLTQCSKKSCSELYAVLAGEPVDPARHIFKYDIKAVTYHEFAIRREDNLTMIQFLCDL
ncbi:archease [candidate division KSB1 bacterium]|nr:MAG: archease [candidate division KSB1 bacterium]